MEHTAKHSSEKWLIVSRNETSCAIHYLGVWKKKLENPLDFGAWQKKSRSLETENSRFCPFKYINSTWVDPKTAVTPATGIFSLQHVWSSVGDQWHFGTNPETDPRISTSDYQIWIADPGWQRFKYRSYGSGTLVKSHKEATKQKKSGFFLLICLTMEGSGADPDLYLWQTDPDADPGGPLATLVWRGKKLK